MKPKLNKYLICCAVIISLPSIEAIGEAFKVSFQHDGSWSGNEWMEYTGRIPRLKEFTVCHWEKLRYMSTSETTVWTYCSILSKDNAPFKCIGVYSGGIRQSANRKINIGAWIEGWTTPAITGVAEAEGHQHRTWNHFCWTYSSTKSQNKLYYNGRMIGNFSINLGHHSKVKTPIIDGNDDTFKSAFIIGQDQDSIKGGYDPAETFDGEIAGLNMWDSDIGDSKINLIVQCESNELGNAVSWKKELWYYSKVTVIGVKDATIFCQHQKQLVVFPQPETLSYANTICELHGGSLVVPQSQEENKKVIKLLLKHKTKCMGDFKPINKGKTSWLGLERIGMNWQDRGSGYFLTPKNYSNWRLNGVQSETGCAFMDKEGVWVAAHNVALCDVLQLCYVCSFYVVPVFTLKGLCEKGSAFDWNYYMHVNTSNQLEYFDGYKKLSSVIHLNGQWSNQIYGARIEIASIRSPLGRMMWNSYEFACGTSELQESMLSFSVCRFGEEFTCDSGHCVDIPKRCNNINDCTDNSDENDCDLVYVPRSYQKVKPPNTDKSEILSIGTKVTIITIDVIDTVQMQMGLTIDVNMKWRDSRLRFRNLVPGQSHLVSTETSEKIWRPLEKIIYENGILGKMHAYKTGEVSVLANQHIISSFETMSPYEDKEDFWYEGRNHVLEMTLRQKIAFTCPFDLVKFPFDNQECNFILHIRDTTYSKIRVSKNDPSIVYSGPKKINEFDIIKISSWTKDVDGNESFDVSQGKFTFSINMSRNFDDHIIMLFYPTLLLWFIVYSTFFLRPEDIANRTRISVTILLVLVSLIGSTKDEIPKTSYFKHIDMWFIWYIFNIFLIICFHIFMEYCYETMKITKPTSIVMVQPHDANNSESNPPVYTMRKASIRSRINQFMATLMFLAAMSFNVAYYIAST